MLDSGFAASDTSLGQLLTSRQHWSGRFDDLLFFYVEDAGQNKLRSKLDQQAKLNCN